MATRFYLPDGGTVPTISPPYAPIDSMQNPLGSRSDMATTKQNTSLATLVSTWAYQNYGYALYNQRTVRQFIGPPMSAQTISGTFSAVLKTAATESSSVHPADVPNQDRLHISVWVYSSTNVQHGYLYSANSFYSAVVGDKGQAAATTLETRIYPSVALDSLAISDGDRLVVNIGWRGDIDNNHTRSFVFGDPAATVDHTLVAGQTMVGVPWIEFSQDLFGAVATVPNGSATGSVLWAGVALGAVLMSGTALGATTWTGSATGTAPSVSVSQGAGSGTTAWAGIASGMAPTIAVTQGAATGATSWAGLANGSTLTSGAAAGVAAWAGTADGAAPTIGVAQGDATGTWTFTGAANGLSDHAGMAAGTWTYVGAASGANTLTPRHNITVTATLPDRRWAGKLTPRRWEGHLL